MNNLSCDVCYEIGEPDRFFSVSERLFHGICLKFDTVVHEKLHPDDKRYVCIDCIETLKKIN